MLKSVWEWMISLSVNAEVHLSCIDSWWKLSSIQWGLTTLRRVCLRVCVLLCKCVSDAANCPFAVYPMGSGMSLVTACSFSLNGPVAMAAPQRPAPPCPRTESDRPIRAGRCDMQSAVITALRREEPGRGHHTPAGSQQDPSPNKHDELGALQVILAPRARHPHPSITCGTCHPEQLAVIPAKRAAQTTPPRGLLGTRQTATGWLSCVIPCWRSSSPVTLHTLCCAIILSSLHPLGKKSVWQFR